MDNKKTLDFYREPMRDLVFVIFITPFWQK